MIRFDAAHVAVQYLSFALAGIPYMGVGRNLAYQKSLFYENNGFISHYTIPSGDDDLFINRVASRSNTSVMLNPGSFAYSEPKRHLGQMDHPEKKTLLNEQVLQVYSQVSAWRLFTFNAFVLGDVNNSFGCKVCVDISFSYTFVKDCQPG